MRHGPEASAAAASRPCASWRRRVDNDKQVSFDLGIEEDAFRAGDDIQSGGVLKEGRGFSFGPLGMQFIGGKTRLTSAGMQEGDKVEGDFEGDVMKLVGMGL